MSELTRRGMSRRNFLRGLSALSVGGVLVACGPSGSPSSSGEGEVAAPAQEGVTVDFWIFWTQPGKIADQLMASESLAELMGDNTLDLKTGMEQEASLTAVAGGTPPSIGAIGKYLDYMSRGAVIPLDDYVETSDIVSPDKFIPGNWNVVQYEGKVYGVPAIECFVRRGLNYNERMVAEAGLDPDNPPVTWVEALDWHEKLTTFDDAGNLIQFGLDAYDAEGGVGPSNDGWTLPESWGFEWFNEDTGEFNLDNPQMAEGLEVMGEFTRIIGPDNLEGVRGVEGQGTWGGSYNNEIQAMIIEGYWHPGETANEAPDVSPLNRASWVPVPEERRGAQIQFGGGHMVQIFKEGTYKDEAWPVAEWLQTAEPNDLFFEQIGWLPAYIPYFDVADKEKFPGLKFYFDSIEETNEWGPFIRCEIQSFVVQKYIEAREAVFRDEMTGAQAAAQMQEEAEKEWKAAGFG